MNFTLSKIDNDVENNMLLLRNLTVDNANDMLNPTESFVEDDLNYKNMNLGVEKLFSTIDENKMIAILVDNDVDGFASSSIMYDFIFNICSYNNLAYIIHENPKAHGLTKEVVDKLIASDVELLIVPDSGSNNFNYINILKQNNIDVLVLDHHEIEITDKELKILDNLILINNQDGQVKNINLSGTGVTYKFINQCFKSMNKEIGDRYIDLVALSVISDVCNMKNLENRYYYNRGNKVNIITNPLLLAFCKKLKKNKNNYITIEDYGFAIAPYINAIVRLGDMEEKSILFNAFIGCEDLIEHTFRKETKLITYQEKVIKLGESYKGKQKRQVDNSLSKMKKIIEDENLDENKIIMVNVTGILPNSLKGLVCNKLLDLYKRPIFLTSDFKKDLYAGSSRGFTSLIPDLKEFCDKSDLFTSTEGHPNSFGHKIKKENVKSFIDYANKNITKEIEYSNEVENVYEGEVPLEDILKIGKYEDLWCNQIKPPKYLVKNVVINTDDIRKIGNATYKFMINGVLFEKDFGSKVWFNDFIKDGVETIKADILVEFRQNKFKKVFCKIINTESVVINS